MGQTLFKDFPDKRVSIVGMGYVGLTLAVVMADVGFEVEGTEVRDDVLEMLENNTPHFAEMGLENKLKSVRKTISRSFKRFVRARFHMQAAYRPAMIWTESSSKS